jgi:asparagine synthase (glutamine-hydrolysing)
MCGIAGIITGRANGVAVAQAKAMSDSLAHRGPDGEGVWYDAEKQICLAHRRLSIIDLTSASDQPLRYGKYVLVYNGEIYNYRELKTELAQKGYTFHTSGDAEVIPAAFDCWGNDCLHHFDGMFAFALYDTVKHKMLLARDRFGEKPLYFHARYAERGRLDYLLFASEMKALWAAGAPRNVNHTMMLNYLSLGYVQNPIIKTDTFFKEILNLPPGYLLDVETDAMRFTMKRWYEPYKRIGHLSQVDTRNEAKVIEQFHDLLMHAVQLRLRSDVPVGTSLSGGLDSSSIVAAIDVLHKKHSPVEGWANVCFSAVFPGFEKDESKWSEKVAEQFGISRYTVNPTDADLTQLFGEMMYHQDEPVQSSSVMAQYSVYALAKEEAVSVLLDGQGADEILAGYSRYSHWYLQQMLRSNRATMLAEKKMLQANGMLDEWGVKNYVAAWLPHQTAQLLKNRALQTQNKTPLTPDYFAAHQDKNTLFKPEIRTLEDILYFNTFNFGLEELLRYADRNSMAHSREVRLPFLSHELVEFIFSLPPHFKIRQGFGKWILRQAMDSYLPKEVNWRTGKVGFEPPQQQWLQQKGMQSLIMESRKKLSGAGIILASEIDRPISDSGAHAQSNYDWRYLCAAKVIV